MTYVMSDIHGRYALYRKMLEKIGFSSADTLYILGDIFDRGEEVAELYLDIRKREKEDQNVFMIKGNHEDMGEPALEHLWECYQARGVILPSHFNHESMPLWLENGGETTVISLFSKIPEQVGEVLDYIRSLPCHRTVEVEDIRYVLVHGGLGERGTSCTPEQVSKHEKLWSRPDFDGHYFKGEKACLIVGHTPTFLMRNLLGSTDIYRGKGNLIAIDCGAAYPEYGGKLGCLCLETQEEFYVTE